MPIHTVLGPIAAEELGATSMHEHLLIDATTWYSPSERATAVDRVEFSSRGELQWNPLGVRDNLILDDPAGVTDELREVKRAGGSGIVDLTVIGLGRQPHLLPRIARDSDLHVMTGCGFYLHETHPDWLETVGVEDLAAFLVGELEDGIEGTGIRPALIGEIGTSSPITSREKKVLAAAGTAASQTGAAVNVHLDREGEHALEAITILTAAGVAPERVVCSHLDERLDWGYHRAVAETGAVLEYDTFGQEFYFEPMVKNPSDVERLEFVARMVGEGFGDQLVLGCDVWVKAATSRFGGMGYEHLMKRIVPAMTGPLGLSAEQVDAMLISTPRRILERP
jgi:phosphotriesterase-related protein